MIRIDVTNACIGKRFSGKKTQRIVGTVLRKEGVRSASISVVFVGDRTIRALNKKFLHHNFNTDVITFPLTLSPVESEIYVNLQQARRQAWKARISSADEVTRLVVHGVLHLLGYDDRRTKDRGEMFKRQEQYVHAFCRRKV